MNQPLRPERIPSSTTDLRKHLAALPSEATRQFAINLVVPIVVARLESLRAKLAELNLDVSEAMTGLQPARKLNFGALPGVHYARFVILPSDARAGERPMLAFSANFDAPAAGASSSAAATESFLHQLVHTLHPALQEIYRNCDSYPNESTDPAALLDYLSQYQLPSATFYVGSSGRSCSQILAEQRLSQWVLDEIDRANALGRQRPTSAHELRQWIRSELASAGIELSPFPPQPNLVWKVVVAAVLFLAAFLLCLPISLPLLVAWAVILRKREKSDAEFDCRDRAADNRHAWEMTNRENFFLQNQLTHLVAVKPGMFRLVTLRVVFFALQFLAVNIFNKGKLGNIPSIHFARWLFIDNQSHLLFFSNFDSSWESYLGDFVDQASNGLTGVWSNTTNYPRSKWLLFAGSQAENLFKEWARHYQLPTDIWYAAYPTISICNINHNTQLRRGLADPNCMPADTWLRYL